MDWELRSCARHGHATYVPDEAELRARLQVETPEGEAWRCLRCGTFVLGPARGAGPADDAPMVLRGRALRQAIILRVLGAERIVRGVLLVLGAYALVRLRSSQGTLRQLFARDLPAARPLADALNIDLDRSGLVALLRRGLTVRAHTLALVAALLALYAAVEVVEGVGLWLARRWAEYLTVVATAAFLPLEVFELTERVTVTRVVALVANIAAVVYLLLAKRLFGLRGGRSAFEAERHEASLLEVETAAGA